MSIFSVLFPSKEKKRTEDVIIPQAKKPWDDSSSPSHVSLGIRAIKVFAKNHRISLMNTDQQTISFAIRSSKVKDGKMIIQEPIDLWRGNTLFCIQKIVTSPKVEVVFTTQNTKTGEFQPEKKEIIVF